MANEIGTKTATGTVVENYRDYTIELSNYGSYNVPCLNTWGARTIEAARRQIDLRGVWYNCRPYAKETAWLYSLDRVRPVQIVHVLALSGDEYQMLFDTADAATSLPMEDGLFCVDFGAPLGVN